ncbi:MAG: hypothetical protein JWQ35_311 [Bacteriovoracaceae bacterium]|nr:hypothetical protein [Bacteriovoracaceae bacterium]
MENTEQKTDRGHDLFWMNPVTGKRIHAGKAFYDERFNEYRLKIDETPDDKQFYLKPMGAAESEVRYRVEQVIKKSGKFHHREEKGDGYTSPETAGEVHIDFGSSMKVLVLSFNSNSKQKENSSS